MKKLFSLVLSLAMVFAMGSSAMAYDFKEKIEPEEPMIPAYVATGTITAELEIKSSNATCSYYVKPFTGYNCNVTAVLQRSTNGSTWTNIKTWTEPKAILHDITRTYAVLSGYKYRLQLTVKTYNSSGTLMETITKYSSVVSY